MNERIQQLADKLWEKKYWTNPNTDKLLPAQLNRFAELIVWECMSIIKQGEGLGEEDDFDKGFQAGIAMAYNRVRTQMGVEE